MKNNFERNFINNQNGTDKTNTISENPTKIEASFDFTMSLILHTRKRVRLCMGISEIALR